jgi:hypothetical protein
LLDGSSFDVRQKYGIRRRFFPGKIALSRDMTGTAPHDGRAKLRNVFPYFWLAISVQIF